MPQQYILTESDKMLSLFCTQNPNPTKEDVARWCRDNPEHATDIEAFAETLRAAAKTAEGEDERIVRRLFERSANTPTVGDLLRCAEENPAQAPGILSYIPALSQRQEHVEEQIEPMPADIDAAIAAAERFARFNLIRRMARLEALSHQRNG